jgi:hypothetical protein
MLCCKKLLKFLKIIKSPKIREKFVKNKKIERNEKNAKNINIPIKSYIIELKMQDNEIEEVEGIEKVLNKNSGKRLYCTHCGYLFPKPEIPVNYIITCEKCYRPLDLPKKYYTT